MVRPPMITAVPHLLLYSPFLSLFFYFYFMFYFIYLFIFFFSPFPSTRRILSAAGMNSVERSPPKKKKKKKTTMVHCLSPISVAFATAGAVLGCRNPSRTYSQ